VSDSDRIAELTAELAWLRRLTRALLREDGEDVAHDTWLIAAKQAPTDGRPLRPWLARVARNVARMGKRSDVRRERREDASRDTTDPVPSPEALVARAEAQRAVVDSVLALDEPYRSTVLLRYFEDFTSAEIARRIGVPEGTVRRRLKEAIDRLRADLGADRTERKRMLAPLLLPLASARHAPSTVIGVLAMKKLIAIVIVVAALAVGFLWKHHRAAPSRAAATTTRAPAMLVRRGADQGLPSWLAQDGVAPRRIAGHVTANGAAVAGATVKLALRVDAGVLQPLADVTAGPDGAFDFGPQPAAVLDVSAGAPDHASASLTVVAADPHANTEHLVLELAGCRSRMSGAVLDAGGGAIAGAHLSSGGLVAVDSDASGHYSLCLTPLEQPGQAAARVRVEADSYGSLEEDVLVAGDLHRDFVLAPEAVLIGRVTAGGQPVAGARVIATPDRASGMSDAVGGFADSDRDGRFRIAGLAPGKFQLAAIADHLGTATPMVVVARPAATSREIHLELTAFARVRGRVVMDGAPVVGAAVAVSGSPRSSISQPDGSFVLDHVPYGKVTLVAPPYRVVKPTSLAVATMIVDGVELDVGKAATLRGHVTRKGKPVPGAGVSCAFSALGTPGPFSTTAGADGAYVLEGLPAGAAMCSAWQPGLGAFGTPPRVQLAATDDKTLDIELEYAGEVKGIVVDEAAHPVPGAYVFFQIANSGDDGCGAMTDGSGAFDCAPLTGGEYTVTVSPAPGTHKPLAPATGDHFDPITVPKDGALEGVTLAVKNQRLVIQGSVVDDTGASVADVRVQTIARGEGFGDAPSSMTDADGKFELADLSPGNYNLYAHAANGSETEVTGVAAGAQNVTITLPRTGEIDGTLAGFSATPSVTAQTFNTDLALGANAIVDGTTFVAAGLTPGHYVVQAEAGAETDSVAVDVSPGQTAHVALTSRGTGHVAGRVTELATGAPIAGMICFGMLSTGGQWTGALPDGSRQVTSDASGRFEVSAPLGRVRAICFTPDGPLSPAGTDVDVAPSSEPEVALVAVRATYGATPGNAGFLLNRGLLPISVSLVDPNGPAAKAGLVAGDQLVTIDGQSLQGMLPPGARTLIMNHHPGTTLVLGVDRGGTARTIAITVSGS